MLIRNDIIHMHPEQEEKHIIKMLNKACKNIGCKFLLVNNKNTINDRVFISLFDKNYNELNVELIYINNEIKELNNSQIKYFDILPKEILEQLLNTNEIAIINTDTELVRMFNKRKINYNISVFKDYSQSFIINLGLYYDLEVRQFNNAIEGIENIDIQIAEAITSDNKEELLKYTKEQLINFNKKVTTPNKLIRDLVLYNSITYNYITGVNEDLEKYNN